jgi:hypothetical protein
MSGKDKERDRRIGSAIQLPKLAHPTDTPARSRSAAAVLGRMDFLHICLSAAGQLAAAW